MSVSLPMKMITLRLLLNVRLTKLKVNLSVPSVAEIVLLWCRIRAPNVLCIALNVLLVLRLPLRSWSYVASSVSAWAWVVVLLGSSVLVAPLVLSPVWQVLYCLVNRLVGLVLGRRDSACPKSCSRRQ